MRAERTPPPTSARAVEPGAFGALLRRSREAQGISLDTVAHRTRIAPHHLEALERSDLDALPGGPFGKSYVRAYAEALGIDPAPILAAYRVQERQRGLGSVDGDRRLLEQLSRLAGRSRPADEQDPHGRRRTARLAVAAAAAVILAAAGWFATSLWPRLTPAGRVPHTARPASPDVAAPRPLPMEPRPAAGPGTPRQAGPASEPPPRGAVTARSGQSVHEGSVSPPTDSLRVAGFGIGTAVADRRLLGRGDRFPEGTRVVFWTEVLGGLPGHVIRHVWFQAGRAVMKVNLPVRGPHWRTQSSLVLPPGSAGPWTVEARTSDGRLLARNDFVCDGAGRALAAE